MKNKQDGKKRTMNITKATKYTAEFRSYIADLELKTFFATVR